MWLILFTWKSNDEIDASMRKNNRWDEVEESESRVDVLRTTECRTKFYPSFIPSKKDQSITRALRGYGNERIAMPPVNLPPL